jgi:uncharacterized OsmC-like protein
MMNTLRITYDELQHCTALREPQGNTVAMDCPYTGKGEEFSPGNLVGAGLAGCILISMGTLALRDKIDISGTNVDVQMTQTDKRIEAISLLFSMPRNFSAQERVKLERAAGLCPIKPELCGNRLQRVVPQA